MTFQKSASHKLSSEGHAKRHQRRAICDGVSFLALLSTAEINMAQHATLAFGFSNKELVERGNKYKARITVRQKLDGFDVEGLVVVFVCIFLKLCFVLSGQNQPV